jgi:hypothetical protein
MRIGHFVLLGLRQCRGMRRDDHVAKIGITYPGAV